MIIKINVSHNPDKVYDFFATANRKKHGLKQFMQFDTRAKPYIRTRLYTMLGCVGYYFIAAYKKTESLFAKVCLEKISLHAHILI